jgi:hypothetical protein
MTEGIYVLSVAQLEFSVLEYCVSSFIGGQNFGTASWSHLQGTNVQQLFLDFDAMSQRNREQKMAEWSLGFLR